MPFVDILLLVSGGLAAGFVAGIIGVGGGIIFAPVLYFYFESAGIDNVVIAPLVIGTSLFCTLIATLASSWHQHQRRAVDWRIAAGVGIASAAAIVLMTRFVTTQPWFDGDVFKVSFSVVLTAVVIKMLLAKDADPDAGNDSRRPGLPFLAGVGSAAGVVSSAAGVGGGVILVPSYHQLLHMPMIRSIGTSSGTITFISTAGILSYMVLGSASGISPIAVGYVDIGTALLLAVPSTLTVRLGVHAAHRINRVALRRVFAFLALAIVIRLLASAL